MDNEKKDPSESDDFVFPKLHPEEESSSLKKEEAPPPEKAEVKEEKTSSPPPASRPATPYLKVLVSWVKNNRVAAMAIAFVFFGAFIWGVNAWRQHQEAAEEGAENAANAIDEVPVNVIEARRGQFRDEINATGELKGEVEIELRFEVDGTIQQFNFSNGATIKRGQIIAKLNDRDASLKVQRAKIELEQNEKLFTLGGISKTKLDEARLNLDVAQSELDKTRIVAKIDGILGDKAADVGEFVTPQRKIATLVSIKSVM